MKKTIMVVLAAAMAMFAGCKKELPTPEKMEATAKAVGVATGLVANQTKLDDKARATIIEVVTKVSEVTPAQGQSFEDAWTPVAKEVVDKLVAEGKLDAGTGVIVMAAFQTVTKGIDYIFDVKYPKAKEVESLVTAAVRGFTDGFLTAFTPSNAMKAAKLDYDKEAYEYLTK